MYNRGRQAYSGYSSLGTRGASKPENTKLTNEYERSRALKHTKTSNPCCKASDQNDVGKVPVENQDAY